MTDSEFQQYMEEIIELAKDESSNPADINAMCMHYFESYMVGRKFISLELFMLFLDALTPEFRTTFEEHNIHTVASKFLKENSEIAKLLQNAENLVNEQQFIYLKVSIPGSKDANNPISKLIFPEHFPLETINKALSFRELLSFDEAYKIFKYIFIKLFDAEAHEELREFCCSSDQNRIFCQNMFLETSEYLRRTNYHSNYLRIQCEISKLYSALNIGGLPWTDNTISDVFVLNNWIPVIADTEVKSE